MNKLLLTIVAGLFAGTSFVAIAADDMKSGKSVMMGNMMKQMDTNNDGMLSKEEFMSGHEKMFDHMKGKNDMITLSDKQTCCSGMMGHEGMKDHGDMKGHEGMKDQGTTR